MFICKHKTFFIVLTIVTIQTLEGKGNQGNDIMPSGKEHNFLKNLCLITGIGHWRTQGLILSTDKI